MTSKEAFLGNASCVSMIRYIDNVGNVPDVRYTSHLRRKKRDIAENFIHALSPHRQSQWANHLSQGTAGQSSKTTDAVAGQSHTGVGDLQ